MIIMIKLYTIVMCHCIGDYVLQNDFLAKTKGENWYHLAIHCFLYSLPFFLAFGWCWQLTVVTILHFPIDILKARYDKITYTQDQILHCLLALLFLI